MTKPPYCDSPIQLSVYKELFEHRVVINSYVYSVHNNPSAVMSWNDTWGYSLGQSEKHRIVDCCSGYKMVDSIKRSGES